MITELLAVHDSQHGDSQAMVVFLHAAFEHEALLNALRHIEPLGLIAMTFIAIPTVSLAWLFGALAGTVFVVLGRRFA